MIRYLYNSRGYYVGRIEIDDKASYPPKSTTIAPPELNEGEYARFNNTDWEITGKPRAKVPQKVTRMQALVAMRRAGILGQVRSIFNGQPNDNEDRLKFEEAAIFNRRDDLITAIGTELGLTEQEIDDIFIEAANIT